MSRRKKAVKRKLLPDPKFNNVLAARFINSLMKQGKRSVAERIFTLLSIWSKNALGKMLSTFSRKLWKMLNPWLWSNRVAWVVRHTKCQ